MPLEATMNMPSRQRQEMIPLERYRQLIAALSSSSDAWDDAFWLRFAAQAAVMSPDSPTTLAHRIRDVSDVLQKRSHWYQTLASPARFVIAAMLIQHHLPVATFIAEHARIAALMTEVGLRHGRFHETIAVLILLMSPGHQPAALLELERVKAIYDQMKHFHWWLTGPADLPACAALAQCPGSVERMMVRVEDAYQQLHGAGMPTGKRLQTAAHLLPLGGPDLDQTVARYRALAEALGERTGHLSEMHYDPLALLALLEHRPAQVLDRLAAVTGELDLLQPECRGEANLLIASDLTVLDLVRCGQDLQPHSNPQAVAHMLRTLHAYHLASAVLISQVEPDLVQFVGAADVAPLPYV
jgi:hypothetical protein